MSIFFKPEEFFCKCGCGLRDIDQELVTKLDVARGRFGRPMVISSGCRCSTHNAAVGGKLDSAHLAGPDLLCHAADVKCLDSRTRYDLFLVFLSLNFKRIGIAKTFIHVDNARHLPQDMLWPY